MSLADLLNLTTVQIAREVVTPDGMGGATTSTTLTTLAASALWQLGANNRFLSDKVTKASTHVLVFEPASYTWANTDVVVVYGSGRYKVTGHDDDPLNLGEMTVVGLERLT